MATTKLGTRRTQIRALAILATIATVGALAACSSTPGSSDSGNEPAAHPSGTLKILVSSAPGSDSGFKAVNKAFAAQYPDVKIEFSSIANDNYPAARASRLSAGNIDVGLASPVELPSYVPKSNEGDDARLAKAGGLVDLTKMSFMKNFTPSVLDSIKFDGKQYTVPTGLSYYTGVYYNKAIFQKYGLSIPTTWDEFVTLCNTLKSDGVTPLGIGGKDGWPAGLNMMAAVQGMYPTAQDKQDLTKSLWQQKTKLTDPKMEEVLQKTSTMFDYAQQNFAGVAYSSIPSGFVNGSFAMTADGTWNETTIAAAAGSGFDFGYFPIPTSDNAADNTVLGGKAELTLSVPSNSKNKGAALAYLKFFSQPKNYESFVKLAGFAPSQPNISLSPFLTSIEKYTKVFTPAWDTVWIANTKSGAKATFPFNYPGMTPLGSGTVAQAAEAAQKDWAAGF
jgi:raffinose/stachyose/melibiose transport system substrate-binding protein